MCARTFRTAMIIAFCLFLSYCALNIQYLYIGYYYLTSIQLLHYYYRITSSNTQLRMPALQAQDCPIKLIPSVFLIRNVLISLHSYDVYKHTIPLVLIEFTSNLSDFLRIRFIDIPILFFLLVTFQNDRILSISHFF